MEDQSLCSAGGGCVFEWDGFWPLRKSIHHSEEVGITIGGWKQSHKIQVNVVELSLAAAEGFKQGFDVHVDFGCPSAHLPADHSIQT